MSAVPAEAPSFFQTRNGNRLSVRPMWRGDIAALRRMHARLSPDAIYRRFMTTCPRGPSPTTLRYLTNVDHVAREALVATYRGEIIAVARYHVVHDGAAEIAVLVEDAWQRQGLARELVTRLTRLARERGIAWFSGSILGENRAAVQLLKSLFPEVHVKVERGEIEFRIPLAEQPFAPALVNAS